MAEIYFSQMSVIHFCRGFSCCLYYRGVRNKRGVHKARVDCTELNIMVEFVVGSVLLASRSFLWLLYFPLLSKKKKKDL